MSRIKTKYGELKFWCAGVDWLLCVNNIQAGVVVLPSKDLEWTFLGNGDVPMSASQYRGIAQFLDQLNAREK